ncbi:tRNA (adenine-N(1)-)-methyltransferase catalytic subunit trm61 [Rhizina undulata]
MSNKTSDTVRPLRTPSAFLRTPDAIPVSQTPSIIHLKRDLLLPVALQPADLSSAATSKKPNKHRDGRDATSNSNGILNTRFGDFPHSTLVGIPYGSQVRASSTGNANNRKRKRKEDAVKVGSGDASSGFLHVLAPTAELWTTSLPHRTQVVYTPDSSYILHRLQVRPGTVLIEAGAGSGSFSHAAVRAVYHGYPDGREGGKTKDKKLGKIYSYEFHKERVGKLKEEIDNHGLDGLVEVIHRDVCKNGFLLKRRKGLVKAAEDKNDEQAGTVEEEEEYGEDFEDISPEASAIFLDLPAPWLAIPHLTRRVRGNINIPSPGVTHTPSPVSLTTTQKLSSDPTATVTASIPLQDLLNPDASSSAKLTLSTADNGSITLPTTPAPGEDDTPSRKPTVSPLSSREAVRLCTFSPCIEQVTRTVSVMRKLGWMEIEMVEIQHHRLEVRRTTLKGYEDGAGPRSVDEAVKRLKWIGGLRDTNKELLNSGKVILDTKDAWKKEAEQDRQRRGNEGEEEGRLMTRSEPEKKSHTSYLTFAVLPREWTEEDEEQTKKWVASVTKGVNVLAASEEGETKESRWKGEKVGKKEMSKRQIKKMEREKRKATEVEAKAVTGEQMEVDEE